MKLSRENDSICGSYDDSLFEARGIFKYTVDCKLGSDLYCHPVSLTLSSWVRTMREELVFRTGLIEDIIIKKLLFSVADSNNIHGEVGRYLWWTRLVLIQDPGTAGTLVNCLSIYYWITDENRYKARTIYKKKKLLNVLAKPYDTMQYSTIRCDAM